MASIQGVNCAAYNSVGHLTMVCHLGGSPVSSPIWHPHLQGPALKILVQVSASLTLLPWGKVSTETYITALLILGN